MRPINFSKALKFGLIDFITVVASYINLGYLVGTPVENYLANHANSNYCLVSSYQVAGVEVELRTKATPISYYDFATYRTIRNLRVDFPEFNDSMSTCNGQPRILNDDGDYVLDTSSPSPIYNPAEICSSCTSMITSYKTRLFKQNGSYLDEVPASNINVPSLSIQVDPN